MGKDDGRKVMNGLILILFLGFLAIMGSDGGSEMGMEPFVRGCQ